MLLLALADAHIPDRAVDLPLKFKELLNTPDKISHAVLLGNCSRSPELVTFVRSISAEVTHIRGECDYQMTRVRGNSRLPLNAVLQAGEFKIGCCSAYNVVPKGDPSSLLGLARQLDVDIVLWGGTHNVEAYILEDKLFVNPGSCTGAMSTDLSFEEEKEKSVEVVDDKKPKKENDTEAVPNTDDDTNLKETEVEKPVQVDALDLAQPDEITQSIPSFCLLDIHNASCTVYIYTYLDNELTVDKVSYTKANQATSA